jgi:arylsulfatase A-like enzyme
VRAYREHDECRTFASEAVARHVRPAYMGLVAQIDDHLARLFTALDAAGRFDDTLIVFTSDHGEFGGDRGLGEKELPYDEIVRVPLIVFDPDARAGATRGRAIGEIVEAVDVLPTVLDALDLDPASHRVEGRSLLAYTRGAPPSERDAAFSELDYGFRRARRVLGRDVQSCRAWMVRTRQWKYVHWQGLRPQLFDLLQDPLELVDRGADARCARERGEMRERLFDWLSTRKRRTTVDDATVDVRTDAHRRHGIHIGIW